MFQPRRHGARRAMLSRPFHKTRWAGYFLVLGGMVMIVAGVWYAAEAVEFLDTTARADGVVIALKRERGAKGFAVDHPVVRFVLPENGKAAEFKSRFGLWPSPFAVGEAVEVAYDPAAPAHAKINSFWTIWLLPVLLELFGVACSVAGFLTLRQTAEES